MVGSFNPSSPILIITVDTNHKTKENESKQYKPQEGFCFSGISNNNVAALTKNRQEIFRLLKENKVRWPEDEKDLMSVAVDAKKFAVKRGIGGRYWSGFAGAHF